MKHSESATDYVARLRSIEHALEAALAAKNWEQMMTLNQELQHCFQQIDDDGYKDLAPVQQALARVQILCSAITQVCLRHRTDSLAMIKKTRTDRSALSSYQQASSFRDR